MHRLLALAAFVLLVSLVAALPASTPLRVRHGREAIPHAAASPVKPSSASTSDDRWALRVAAQAAVDPKVDCPLKAFAAEFAAYLQPTVWPHASNWTEETVAAMELPTLCKLSVDDIAAPPFHRPSTVPPSRAASSPCAWTRYVDGAKGKNTNAGSLDAPWQEIVYALAQSRTRGATTARACIIIRGGLHYFGDHQEQMGGAFESQLGAMALTPHDSNLTIAAYEGETVVFSGGVALTGLQWSAWKSTAAGTIMRAPLPANVVADWDHFNELFIDGARAVRAKFPNGDPFLTSKLTSPTGYVSGAASWIGPDPAIVPATEIHVSEPVPNSRYFPQFQIGVEGTVSDFDPPHSYWALKAPPGGGGSTYVKPRGFKWNRNFSPRAANWSNPTTGRVFTFHGRGWGSWQYAIAAVHPENETVVFGAGGWQEARGDGGGGLMYVHNILEELDDVNEWFVDERARMLYFMSNGTAPSSIIASQVPCVLSVQGSQQSPVVGVTISGLTFAHTANHFLRSYEAPSGGDYSIHRGGAVFLQGTQDTTVIGNSFEHLGGNALVVSNWNLNATVTLNQFQWLGESAIILIGRSDGIDGVSSRDQPTYTHVEGNLVRDFSVYVKQGDAIFEALSRSSTWAGNLAYNSPRSIFNKNDGFAGGLNIYQNLLFNANKETSDHGPINTWDRQPYMTEEAGHGPSLIAKTNRIHNNFLINDFGSDMTVDHDDGSAFYLDSYNFNMYSGTKNYLGHSKVNDHQLFVFSDLHPGYGFAGCECEFTDGNHDSAWTNNRCILLGQSVPYSISYCNANNVTDVPLHAGNTIYTPSGEAVFVCGKRNLTLAEWQGLGMDKGTTEAKTPSVETVIGWGRQVLFLQSGESVDEHLHLDW